MLVFIMVMIKIFVVVVYERCTDITVSLLFCCK